MDLLLDTLEGALHLAKAFIRPRMVQLSREDLDLGGTGGLDLLQLQLTVGSRNASWFKIVQLVNHYLNNRELWESYLTTINETSETITRLLA